MLGRKIEQRMQEVGIETQTALASRAGLSVQYVNGIIRGDRGKRLGYEAALRLAKALEVDLIFFSTDTATAGNSDLSNAVAGGVVG